MGMDVCPDCGLSISDSDGSCGCLKPSQRMEWQMRCIQAEYASYISAAKSAVDALKRQVEIERQTVEQLKDIIREMRKQAGEF